MCRKANILLADLRCNGAVCQKDGVDFTFGDLVPKKKKWKKPRPFSIVRFRHEFKSPEEIERYYKPLVGKQYIFFGEIPNQPGHYVLWSVGPKPSLVGEPEFFRHTDDFEEIHEDDL